MCFHFHFFAPYMQTLCVGRHSLSPSVFPGIPAPVSRLLQLLSLPRSGSGKFNLVRAQLSDE